VLLVVIVCLEEGGENAIPRLSSVGRGCVPMGELSSGYVAVVVWTGSGIGGGGG